MAKKFKPTDVCGNDIDEYLANNVTDLFRKGMHEELYEKTVKDENCPRPGNCDGLMVAKMNKLVWDVMSPQTRSNDKKMQQIATSIVKAGIFLTKTMTMLVANEQDKSETEREKHILDSCNDALALMGHANYQVNMMRRDMLRPELKREYSHLCTHSLPVTKELFGDDISKTAREIEDSAKIGFKMSGQYGRGNYMYRGRPGLRGLNRDYGHMRGRGQSPLAYAYPSQGPLKYGQDPKNLPRRGGVKYRT